MHKLRNVVHLMGFLHVAVLKKLSLERNVFWSLTICVQEHSQQVRVHTNHAVAFYIWEK